MIFETLPPVLHLQLKRFEYDIERDAMVKINDRHEFPLEIDLAEFVAEGEEKRKAGPHGFNYTLHGYVCDGDVNFNSNLWKFWLVIWRTCVNWLTHDPCVAVESWFIREICTVVTTLLY